MTTLAVCAYCAGRLRRPAQHRRPASNTACWRIGGAGRGDARDSAGRGALAHAAGLPTCQMRPSGKMWHQPPRAALEQKSLNVGWFMLPSPPPASCGRRGTRRASLQCAPRSARAGSAVVRPPRLVARAVPAVLGPSGPAGCVCHGACAQARGGMTCVSARWEALATRRRRAAAAAGEERGSSVVLDSRYSSVAQQRANGKVERATPRDVLIAITLGKLPRSRVHVKVPRELCYCRMIPVQTLHPMKKTCRRCCLQF